MKTKIKGEVISNDGESALVRFRDGAERWFHRTGAPAETLESFNKMFPLHGEFEAQTESFEITDRDSLFDALTQLFPDAPEGSKSIGSIIKVGRDKDHPVLVGQGRTFYGITVFCAPGCEAPDGSEGRVFSIQHSDGSTEWLGFDKESLDYVYDVILRASYGAAVQKA